MRGARPRLAAAHSENGIIQASWCKRSHSLGQPCPLLADKMMIADVEFAKRFNQCLNDLRISVSEIENTAVAMAVDQPLFACGIPNMRPLPLSEDKIDVHTFEKFGFPR